MQPIMLATKIAFKVHKNQMYGNNPYLEHVIDVASRCQTQSEIIVGLLHDTVEDAEQNGFSASSILTRIHTGFGETITDAIIILTKMAKIPYLEYVEAILESENILAITVKKHDITSNLTQCVFLGEAKLRERLTTKYSTALSLFA
jgi:(p)ppGpp synthase/HD superfamily hydrolase